MAKGLSIARVVNVSVSLAAIAAARRNFGAGLIVGDSDVIDVTELIRPYDTVDAVAADFSVNSPELAAAKLFFAQNPRPSRVYIGRWASGATAGRLNCAILTPAQQAMSNFTSVTTGSFAISIDGAAKTISAVDFSGQTNLNGVATVLQTKLAAAAAGTTCVWDAVAGRFIIRSGTTGATSSLSYGSVGGGGASILTLIGLTAASGAAAPVPGVAAQTWQDCVVGLLDKTNAWYSLLPAAAATISDAQHQAVATLIEAASPARIYGVTTQATATLDSAQSGDLASVLKGLKLSRTFVQYSGSSAYAAVSMFGRAATVNFDASSTTLTMMFKAEPGIVAETIPASQADALKAKNANVFVNFDNDTAILQYGTMANGYFFDEIHGTDWLQNAIQTAVYNRLLQAPKVPQTDPGSVELAGIMDHTMQQSVRNGLVAPGQWNGPNVGQLKTGDYLDKGYYIFFPPYSSQDQSDREARKSVPYQIAMKLAGAVHEADVLMNVNR